jgi:hypothetical protein
MKIVPALAAIAVLGLAGCATSIDSQSHLYADIARCADGTQQSLNASPPYCIGHGGVAGTTVSVQQYANWQAEQQRRALEMQQLQAAMAQTAQWSAEMQAQAAAGGAQAAQWRAPQVTPYGQPNAASIYYCRDVTGTIVTCRQLR